MGSTSSNKTYRTNIKNNGTATTTINCNNPNPPPLLHSSDRLYTLSDEGFRAPKIDVPGEDLPPCYPDIYGDSVEAEAVEESHNSPHHRKFQY